MYTYSLYIQRERQPDLRQFVYAPCNGLFWLLLNLKLNATSISTSFSREKIQEEKTTRDLQKNILVLNQHFGSGGYCRYRACMVQYRVVLLA